MSIQRLQSHWGFTRMPFGRNLAPSMLHRHTGHSEAIARITWCVDQCAIGVITDHLIPALAGFINDVGEN